jgi:peptidyl-tRNA hydrolase
MSAIVQYVVVRGDLVKLQKWPLGALVAQACHASSAAIHLFYKAEDTQQYLADLDRMHKVVLEVYFTYYSFVFAC